MCHIFFKSLASILIESWAIIRTFNPLGDHGCENHARRLSALTAICLRKKFQDLEDLRLGSSFIARCDPVTVIPGVIDLPFHPYQDFIRFLFVPERIDRNLPRVDCDEFALDSERHCRRVFEVFKPSEGCIQIGKSIGDILFKMCNAVQGLKARVALRPEDLFAVARQQHGAQR